MDRDGEPWQWDEWAEWAEQARRMGAEALRVKMRQELTEAGQEVVRVATGLALDTYQACQNPVAWGPEPKMVSDPEHLRRDGRPITRYTSFGLTETFWKMQIPVLSVQRLLRFVAWDRAVSQAQATDGAMDKEESQGNQEADDDGLS